MGTFARSGRPQAARAQCASREVVEAQAPGCSSPGTPEGVPHEGLADAHSWAAADAAMQNGETRADAAAAANEAMLDSIGGPEVAASVGGEAAALADEAMLDSTGDAEPAADAGEAEAAGAADEAAQGSEAAADSVGVSESERSRDGTPESGLESAPSDTDAGGAERPRRTRRTLLPKVSRAARCGACHTCLNPHLKKACLQRRKEQLARLDASGEIPLLLLPQYHTMTAGAPPNSQAASGSSEPEVKKALVAGGVLAPLEAWLANAADGGKDAVLLAKKVLENLRELPIDMAALQTCSIGRTMNRLKKSGPAALREPAAALVAEWKRVVDAESGAAAASSDGAAKRDRDAQPAGRPAPPAKRARKDENTAVASNQAAGARRPGHAGARAGQQGPPARVSPPSEGTLPAPTGELAPTELDDSAMFRQSKPAPDPKPKPAGRSLRDALPQLRKAHVLQVLDAEAARQLAQERGGKGGATAAPAPVLAHGEKEPGSNAAGGGEAAPGPAAAAPATAAAPKVASADAAAAPRPAASGSAEASGRASTSWSRSMAGSGQQSTAIGGLRVTALGGSSLIGGLGMSLGSQQGLKHPGLAFALPDAAARAAAAAARIPSPPPRPPRDPVARPLRPVRFREDEALVHVRLFRKEDPASSVGTGDASDADGAAGDIADVASAHQPPPGFQTAARREHEAEAQALWQLHQPGALDEEDPDPSSGPALAAAAGPGFATRAALQAPWRVPPEILGTAFAAADAKQRAAEGEESVEAGVQAARCLRTPRADFRPDGAGMPDSPIEPPPEPSHLPPGAALNLVVLHYNPSVPVAHGQPNPNHGPGEGAYGGVPAGYGAQDAGPNGAGGAWRGGGGRGRTRVSSTPCRFFNTPGGCDRGNECRFAHTVSHAAAARARAPPAVDRTVGEQGDRAVAGEARPRASGQLRGSAVGPALALKGAVRTARVRGLRHLRSEDKDWTADRGAVGGVHAARPWRARLHPAALTWSKEALELSGLGVRGWALLPARTALWAARTSAAVVSLCTHVASSLTSFAYKYFVPWPMHWAVDVIVRSYSAVLYALSGFAKRFDEEYTPVWARAAAMYNSHKRTFHGACNGVIDTVCDLISAPSGFASRPAKPAKRDINKVWGRADCNHFGQLPAYMSWPAYFESDGD
ncbi:hypothetical protein WJX81_007453 [Elliptochloris bilobata]|uniref:Serine/threonine-protein phosphatase 1 regulatory subunit 10 n=1 Tax=Elliptochloris bilobata TaxID=381761 RepID=A0AAW1SL30_9CHLO